MCKPSVVYFTHRRTESQQILIKSKQITRNNELQTEMSYFCILWAQLENEQYRFVVGFRFAIAMVIIGWWCLDFTLPTNNFKSCRKLVNHTKQALPAQE
jgi:ABC-type uncharacterized transport system permease subunit